LEPASPRPLRTGWLFVRLRAAATAVSIDEGQFGFGNQNLQYVPLALVLLGPVIVNIFLFHAFMQPSGLPLALIVMVLWAVTAVSVGPAFAGLLRQKVAA